MKDNILIIINPFCHQGKGWKRWLSIREEVLQLLGEPVTEIVLEKGISMTEIMKGLILADQKYFIISAGGDGSMHYLVNTLLKDRHFDLKNITLGAIGLGSSNDFLKPFDKKINNIPIRINIPGSTVNHDVGRSLYYDETKHLKEEFFIVNASFGVTATANWNFNNPGRILKFLKANFTGAAILYTAIATILGYKNIMCRLKIKNNEMDVNVSNINILKIPYVSGSFWYDQDIEVNDGQLYLNICRDMNKIELLKTLTQLEKGKFNADEKRISEKIDSFNLDSDQPVIFECDGETELARHVSITVVSGAIKVLAN